MIYQKVSITREMFEDLAHINFIDSIVAHAIGDYSRTQLEYPKSIHFEVDERQNMINVILQSEPPKFVLCRAVDSMTKQHGIKETVDLVKKLNPHITFEDFKTSYSGDDFIHNIVTLQIPVVKYDSHPKYRC